MPRVRTPVGELFFEDVGRGPAILLWHSLFSNHGMWRAQAERLKGRYRLLLVDGPGHGLSGPPPLDFDLAGCARASLAVLDAVGVERAVLGGISWGGVVAMKTALLAPGRAQALLLLSTSAEAERWLDRVRAEVLAGVARRFGILRVLEPTLLSSMFSPRVPHDAAVCEELLRQVRAADREAIHRIMLAITRRESILEQLHKLDLPALVVVSSRDEVTLPVCGVRIAGRISGARLEVLKECGHLSLLEAPDEVTPLLEAFLAETNHDGVARSASTA
jgi:pimeloyl-ACP methyl ester carboxylesterase